jgi:hypothetical protein
MWKKSLRRLFYGTACFACLGCFWSCVAWKHWPRRELFRPTEAELHQTGALLPVFGIPSGKPTPKRLAEALQAPISTVVDKKHPSPTGDNRDYVSLSIYWWPNPVTRMPWMPRDGKRNPLAEEYDSPRLRKMAETVSELAAASASEADSRAIEWLQAWFADEHTRMHPHLTFAQMMPGIAAGGRQGIIEGLPLVTELLDALAVMDARGALPAELRQQLRNWLGSYLAWLRQSSPGKAEAARENNHGTWYAVQIIALARSLGLPHIADQQIVALQALLKKQFATDGSQPEEMRRAKSFDYSLYNLEAWWRLEQLARAAGQPSYWPHGPEQAVRFLKANAATWPKARVSGNAVAMLAAFEKKLERVRSE